MKGAVDVDTNVSFQGAAATMGSSSISKNPSSSIVTLSRWLRSLLRESEGRGTMAASAAAEADPCANAPSRDPLEIPFPEFLGS